MKDKCKKIGVMTGGGDCPGLNSVIRAIVKTAINTYGIEVIGFEDGYLGLIYNRFRKLGLEDVSGLSDKGGTILGTTNTFDPFKVVIDSDGIKEEKDMSNRIAETIEMHEIDCLIIIGGMNTIRAAYKLSKKNINVIAIPKTIENDIPGTDQSFGFITALNTATQALDKLHSTAESHHRIMILEVMGRRAGWGALESGMAGGADIILIPEIPYDINSVARSIMKRKNGGKRSSIVCVAEGSKAIGELQANTTDVDYDKQKSNGVGSRIAKNLEELISLDTRVTVLGYLQRGGSPSFSDRLLTTRFGVHAVDMVVRNEFNKMVSIVNNKLTTVDLVDVADKGKFVPIDGELVRIARSMGVCFGD